MSYSGATCLSFANLALKKILVEQELAIPYETDSSLSQLDVTKIKLCDIIKDKTTSTVSNAKSVTHLIEVLNQAVNSQHGSERPMVQDPSHLNVTLINGHMYKLVLCVQDDNSFICQATQLTRLGRTSSIANGDLIKIYGMEHVVNSSNPY